MHAVLFIRPTYVRLLTCVCMDSSIDLWCVYSLVVMLLMQVWREYVMVTGVALFSDSRYFVSFRASTQPLQVELRPCFVLIMTKLFRQMSVVKHCIHTLLPKQRHSNTEFCQKPRTQLRIAMD